MKINTYNETGKNLSKFDLDNSLVGLKQEHKSIKRVHSQVLQNINQRISFAFDNFYNRLEKGEKPGFPRFKGKNRYDSITYPQSGFSLGGKLYVSKMGKLNIVQHRAIEGKIKTLTIKQTPTGKWFATFCAEK
ncbi:MAG: transposase, partial [Candidatus Woesearchaeota archaeon]|nr:transposase [Candidatus Woesearchaeota archaeon]